MFALAHDRISLHGVEPHQRRRAAVRTDAPLSEDRLSGYPLCIRPHVGCGLRRRAKLARHLPCQPMDFQWGPFSPGKVVSGKATDHSSSSSRWKKFTNQVLHAQRGTDSGCPCLMLRVVNVELL